VQEGIVQDPALLFTLASASLTGMGITSFAVLKAWRGWLDLKRARIEAGRRPAQFSAERIEVADLKARIRRLEAIASGIEY
jgi:hypothetical protein